MNINIKATNIELTDAIRDYVEKRVDMILKYVNQDESNVHCFVEVGKITNHHKQGEVFKTEFNLKISGKKYYSVSRKEDLYASIDDVKDEIVRKITKNKDREKTLFKRGALSIKKMLKGLSKRNPDTSKY
jgi:putative sigma-54 modulation protein